MEAIREGERLKYSVFVAEKKFDVEVIELSPTQFEVVVNGKRALIEVSRSLEIKAKASEMAKKEHRRVEKAIKVPMVGIVTKILKKEGDSVKVGEAVAVIEAMKMENQISSPFEGVVEKVLVKPGDKVSSGDTIMILS